MSEHTKLKPEIVWPLSLVDVEIFDKRGRLLAKCYREDIAKILLKHLNAFEEGGLVEDICIQLMDLYDSCVETTTPEVYGTILGLHEKLEATLAKS